MDKYDFINNGEFKITENIGYSTYNIKRRKEEKKNTQFSSSNNNTNISYFKMLEKQSNSMVESIIESNNKKRKGNSFFHKKDNENKRRVIIVDDEDDILVTYKIYLKEYDYHITCFSDPSIALNYIREISNFDNLVIILDIRMKNLNGLQLHHQIKAIDPTIKILFVTALDILDELLSIFPGISKEQILRKPINKNLFSNTIKNMLK